MVNDPVGDFIIRLKNASMAKKTHVAVPYSKMKLAVASVLERKGFIGSVAKRGKKARKMIEVEVCYGKDGVSRIEGVARISKPGRRIYQKAGAMFPVRRGRGVLVVSTPKGILTGEEARKEHVGGEALFKIW